MVLLKLLSLLYLGAFSQDCDSEWRKIAASTTNFDPSSNYTKAYLYSGIFFNNLGDYNSCNNLEGAKYVVLGYSHFPDIVATLCGPSICTEEYYYENISSVIPFISTPPGAVYFPKEYQDQYYGSFDNGAIAMISFIVTITFIVITATIVDYLVKNESRGSTAIGILLCFSVISNTKKLFTSRGQERLGKKDSLEVLNAVRVMSIGWVVLGHTCLIYFSMPALSNVLEAADILTQSKYLLVYGALYAVDTFFWLSGFLMSYLFIIEVEKSVSAGKLVMVYVHRFLRITPVYMFVLCFFWSMQKYIGNGPLWVDLGSINDDCDDYWYANLIYLNNFIPDWEVSTCLGVSWYLANDMQFFWISPIIIMLYIKVNKAIGWISIGLLCILNILSAGLVAYHYGLNPVLLSTDNGANYQYYYDKPYCRVAPYALGLGCGFIIYSYRKYQDTGKVYDNFAVAIGKMQENKTIRWLTFFIGLGLINTLIFCLYDAYKDRGSGNYPNWTEHDNIAFIAFERFTYSIGISMVLLPMLLGHFKGIASFLSLYPWSVMARLTFAIYLIHISIIQIIVQSQQNVLMVGIYYNIRDTIYFFLLATFFAVPVVLLIELPFSNLERLIFKGPPPKKLENNEFRSDKLLLDINKSMNTTDS
jgi:peptidoglycan/LPS O-acetylase OafA/YrhL